ncbi:MAG TPA: cytochrome c oxidase subunit II [Dehalococcoidia bacterium]|nr:cytochrome c oxidase subunit II [Dehalococcoidia bacterium]
MTTPAGDTNRPSGQLIVALVLIVVLAALVLYSSFTVLNLPRGVTEESEHIWNLYQATLAISMVIYFAVTAGIIYAIFRFRQRSKELPQQIHGSSRLELLWTVIPVGILVALFIPSLVVMIDLKTPPSDDEADLVIEVVAHQWWWEFVYCTNGDCASPNNVRVQRTPPNYDDLKPPALVVPTGQKVKAYVRSTDVVHSFYWPRSLYKLQAIPGNVNELHFTVKSGKEGTYSGQCYQFCGLRHADMLFVVDARTPSEFQSWLNEQRRAQGLETTNPTASADRD